MFATWRSGKVTKRRFTLRSNKTFWLKTFFDLREKKNISTPWAPVCHYQSFFLFHCYWSRMNEIDKCFLIALQQHMIESFWVVHFPSFVSFRLSEDRLIADDVADICDTSTVISIGQRAANQHPQNQVRPPVSFFKSNFWRKLPLLLAIWNSTIIRLLSRKAICM